MKNSIVIGIALTIVIVNNIFGHYYAPSSIMFTPIVVIVLSYLIAFLAKNIKAIQKTILLAFMIGLHDVCIKLYAGGTHDLPGLGLIHLMLFVGLVPAYPIFIKGIFRTENEPKTNKFIAVILFPLLMWIHLLIYCSLGIPISLLK